MINTRNEKVWLIGASPIAIDYAKILIDLNIEFVGITRGEEKAKQFMEATGHSVVAGGIVQYLQSCPSLPSHAVITVGVEQLSQVTDELLQYGVRKILVEKPGGMNFLALEKTFLLAEDRQARVFIAYNRRFYSSTLKAQQIIKEDGGVKSFYFEFTEWSHVINKLEKPEKVKKMWFLANSTHVVDLAFYLGGEPEKMSSYSADSVEWHTPAIFSGAGKSKEGALFSYCANWKSPGRWGVEILTNKHRLIFRPMEKLQVQNIGSVNTEFVEIDDSLDVKYKPGLYLQLLEFLSNNTPNLCALSEQIKHWRKIYIPMLGGGMK